MTDDHHAFCRALLANVMPEVRKATTPAPRAQEGPQNDTAQSQAALLNCEAAYRHWRATELMKGRTLLNYREAFARRYHAVTVPPIVALYEETTGEVCAIEPQQRQAA